MPRLQKGGAPRRATLKDVARLAGVSPMTASNVVNGRLKGYNTETRDKVLWAVRSVGYRPDIAARSLRTDKRMAVGMLVVTDGPLSLADPYIIHLLDGLCASLNRHGYSLVLQGLEPRQAANSPLLQQLHSDGLCVLMSSAFAPASALADALRSLGQPIVLFQQTLADAYDNLCVVRQDDFDGGRMLCAHLLQRGARRLLMILPQPDWPAMKARLGGVRHELGQSATGASLTVLTSIDESAAATESALAGHIGGGEPFDAVIAGNDQMAIAVRRMLIRREISVPADVKVTGFNGFGFLDYYETRLTTVRSPAYELGSLGAQHMIRRIEGGRFDAATVILPVRFLPGETT